MNATKNNMTAAEASRRHFFNEQSVYYGLNPEYYMEPCLAANGQTFRLESFVGEYAMLDTGTGFQFQMPFAEAMDMLVRAIDKKMALEKSAKKRAKMAAKKANAINAVNVFNGDMERIQRSMNIGRKNFRFGVMVGNEACEFVSYDHNAGESPYIVESLERNMYDPLRYLHLSFGQLLEGALNYAKSEGDVDSANALACMVEYSGRVEMDIDGWDEIEEEEDWLDDAVCGDGCWKSKPICAEEDDDEIILFDDMAMAACW